MEYNKAMCRMDSVLLCQCSGEECRFKRTKIMLLAHYMLVTGRDLTINYITYFFAFDKKVHLFGFTGINWTNAHDIPRLALQQ